MKRELATLMAVLVLHYAVVTSEAACVDNSVRLVNGNNRAEGRVEICSDGAWGTVCDDDWESVDAGVVCGQLGFLRQDAAAFNRAHFGQGTGEIVMDNVNCDGTEARLIDCPHRGTANANCRHHEDAGVRCQSQYAEGEVRLVQENGSPAVVNSQTSIIRGRVEVYIDYTWGTVCDDFWGDVDSIVACRQLGYSRLHARSIRRFGGGTGPIHLDDVSCSGDERRLVDCDNDRTPNCVHTEDAGVRCNTTLLCNNGEVRLANGQNAMEGRVEMCWDETWGTVCDRSWGIVDGKVVCRQLGLSTLSVRTFSNAAFGQGSGPILLSSLGCTGSEPNLTSCFHSGIGRADFCDHSDDAGVQCQPVVCRNGDLRLAAGLSSFEGRVEVCWNERWGTVCDDLWGATDAQVVCRQLGYTIPSDLSAVAIGGPGRGFDPGNGAILLDDVGCTGSEQRLLDCTHDGIGINDCQHYEDAGVRCSQCSEGSIRLAGGSHQYEGRVEVCVGGAWGTVCDDGWDNNDAAIACRQLGFSTQNAVAVPRASFGQGNSSIAMDDVRCISTDQRLVDCDYRNSRQIRSCSHAEDAGVRCEIPSPAPPRNVVSTALSGTTVAVSWSPPLSSQIFEPVLHYTVTCSASGYPQETLNTHSGSVVNIVVLGLRPFVNYSCCVATVTATGQGSASCSSVQTHPAAPSGPPLSLTGRAVSSTSLSLSWSPPLSSLRNGVIQNYYITLTDDDSGGVITYITTSTNLGVTALHPYYTYQCTVAAVTVAVGPATHPFSVTTFQAAPSGPPLGLTSTGSSNVSFSVRWDPPRQEDRNGLITSYTLSVTRASTGVITTHTTSSNGFTVGSLLPHTLYTCVVAASTVNGTGPASIRIDVRTMEGAPSIPRQIGATTLNSSSLRLFWSPPQVLHGIIRGYRIRLLEVATGTEFELTTPTTSITIPSLHPDYYYQYYVAAYTIIDGPYSFSREVRMPEHVPSASPRNLASTHNSETTIRVSWDSPSEVDRNGVITHYTVRYYSLSEGETQALTTTTVQTSYVISSLRPGTTYAIAVSASTAVGAGPISSHITVTTTPTVPTDYPSNLLLTARSSSSLYISWDALSANQQAGGIAGYNISLTERKTGQQFAFITEAEFHTVFFLHPFYYYDCQVQVFTAMGAGPLSPVASLQMPQDIPSGPPQAFNVTVESAFLISLSWEPPLESERNGIITGYSISVTVEMEQTVQLSSGTTSLEITAQPYKSYEFVVAANTSVGRGPYSSEETVQTPEIAPTHFPRNLSWHDLEATSFRLTWVPPPEEHHNGVITEYRVNVTVIDTGEQFQRTTEDTEIAFSNLHPYYRYNCTVTAVTVDEGPYTASIYVRTHEAPSSAAPLNFQVIHVNSTAILLEWDPPPVDTRNGLVRKYRVIVSNTGTGEQIQEFAFAEHKTIPGLTPDNTYSCKVAAYTIAVGPFTASIQVTTSADAPSGPPQGVTVTASGSRGLVISWSPPRAESQNGMIIRYTVRSVELTTGNVFENNTSSTTLSLTGLHPHYTYACSVAAWTSSGRGPFSSSEMEQLPEDAPSGSPYSLQAIVMSSTSTRLSWSSPRAEDRNGIIRQYHINLTEVNATGQWTLVSNSNTKLLDFLRPYITYQFGVAAVTISQGPFSAVHRFTTHEDIPGQPINLTATSVDPRTLRLNWEPPPVGQRNGVIIKYTVTATLLNPPTHSEYNSSETSLTIGALLPSQTYELSVVAETSVGQGPDISTTTTLPEDIPSGPPLNLNGTALDSRRLQLSWRPPLQANGMIRDYTISVLEMETGTVVPHQSDVSFYNLADLHPFYTYNCSVAANTVGPGPTANVTIQMPADIPTAAPLNLTVEILSPSTVMLTWDPPPINEQNGIISQYVIKLTSQREAEVSKKTELREHQITSLAAFSQYEFAVAAENVEGIGPYTMAITVNTPEDVPSAAPTVGEAFRISATDISITWSPLSVEDSRGIITGYSVKYRPLPEEFRRSLDDVSTVLNTTETSLTIEDLDPRYMYGVAVAASTAVGIGNYSTELTVGVYEENTLFQLHLQSGAILCRHWKSTGATHKIMDIIEHVVEDLQDVCNCEVSSKFIRRENIFCEKRSDDTVIFQAAVVSTEIATSDEIVNHIQEWVYTEQVIISGGVQLTVLPCSVHVAEYGNTTTTCMTNVATTLIVTQSPKNDDGTVVGIYGGVAGGFLLLIVFVIVLITLLVSVRRRQKKRLESLRRPDLRLNITLDEAQGQISGHAIDSKACYDVPEYSKHAEAYAEAGFGSDQEHIYEEPSMLSTFGMTQHKEDLPPVPAYNTMVRQSFPQKQQLASASDHNTRSESPSAYAKLDINKVSPGPYRNIPRNNAPSIRNEYDDIDSSGTFRPPHAGPTASPPQGEDTATGATGGELERSQYMPLFISKGRVKPNYYASPQTLLKSRVDDGDDGAPVAPSERDTQRAHGVSATNVLAIAAAMEQQLMENAEENYVEMSSSPPVMNK